MSATDGTNALPPVSDDLPPVSDDSSAQGSTGKRSPAGALPQQIGRYRILGLLGSGGMGVVYVAEQDNPRRQVALKVMRPGTATPRRLRRFEHEAQALARLEHPGIARIYEADTSDSDQGSQPYFAMELIQGQLITTYATAQQLGVADRLRLLIDVCQAVEFAHKQGVTHRDLKPANILVGGDGRPKVLDFGVARLATSDTPAELTLTGMGELLGTPEYMSPEQATADPDQVDWRTDVYSLGVIAYELLAGRLPRDLRGKSLLAMAQTIREEEPTPLGSLNKAFRGDLDTIVAKALERDKSRRYQSAAELGDDLTSYLNDKPVRARPAGSLYQIRKFARRHRTLVAGIVGVVLALVAGTAAATWSALAARRAEREAQNYLTDAVAAQRRSEDLLADSYEQAARLAGQRGAWREAVALTDKALATDRYHDSVPLRLSKVRALLALDDRSRYVPEIEALAATPNLGPYEASVWLLQGEIQLWSDAHAEELVRRARAKGLPPAEDAYARALLAQTAPAAVAHLRRSLALDPYQPRARTVLELLLILLARLPEARLELSAHEALFPDDVNAKVLRAITLALAGDRAAADAVLDRLRGRLKEGDRAELRALIGLLVEVSKPANAPEPTKGSLNLLPLLVTGAPALARTWLTQGVPDDPKALVAAQRGYFRDLPLPPVLRKLTTGLLHMTNMASAQPDAATLRERAELVKILPEGTLLYLRAMELYAACWQVPAQWMPDRWTEVEKVALEAANTPALFSVHQHALALAIGAEMMIYRLTRKPEVLHRAVANMRAIRALGPYRYPHPELPVALAMLAKDWNLTRVLLDEWEQEDPGNPEALRNRARMELYTGHASAAMQAAEKALKKLPKDAELRRIRDGARTDLLKLLESSPATRPPKAAR